MSTVRRRLGCGWRRNAVALVWIPVLLLGPVLDLHGTPGAVAFQVALVLVIATAAAVAGLTGGPPWRSATPYIALSTLVAATTAGAMHGSSQWLPTWILLANTLPAVLRGRALVGAVPLVALLSMGAAAIVEPFQWSRLWSEGFVVVLAGLASSAVISLIDTVSELRRTRAELARAAVADERERFSRDLHDLLGHTLSVMVVKAQAVRRLAGTDDVAVVEHASDIEEIGRQALVDVRRAVDAMRAPTLPDELDNARRALAAAGIETTVTGDPGAGDTDEVLAWVVREAATNVLRHSGASTCRIELAERGGRLALAVTDDGVGAPSTPTVRFGGLDGLRDRVTAAGGELRVETSDAGFSVVATVPGGGS